RFCTFVSPRTLVLVLPLISRRDGAVPIGLVSVERRIGIRRRIRLALIRSLLIRKHLRALAASRKSDCRDHANRHGAKATHDFPPVGAGACPPGCGGVWPAG